jgi:hypothetical protein
MNHHRAYFPRDDAPAPEGDGGWMGVDMRRDPGQLEAGLAADAVNLRFTSGTAAPRKGLRMLSWGGQSAAGYGPGDIVPYGNIAGAGVFNDPLTGYTWIINAVIGGRVYRARPGTTGAEIPMPAGEVIPARVQLIQTYSGIVMLRGADADPLYCDDLDAGFKTLPAPAAGKTALPRSSHGIYFQNRLFVIYAGTDPTLRDCIYVSDFGATADVLQGSVAFNAFKVNQGSRDALVALYRFNDTTLVALKEESVYLISNLYGTNEDIASNARQDVVTAEYGIKASRSAVQVGSDLWFLAHRRGVSSIRQTETNQLQGVDVPVSRDIQPLIDRINWEHASGATATYHGNRVYFAVPLDNATYNNAVLVYDTLNQKWAGRDEGDAIRVKDWLKFAWAGVVRSVFVSDDGYVMLYEDGSFDHVAGQTAGSVSYQSVETRLLTRGYGGAASGRKRFGEVRVSLATWWPRYSVVAHVDGVNENRTLKEDQTRSRTAYLRPHGKTPWDETNADDDFATKWREDYSLAPTSAGIVTGQNGLQADLMQQTEQGWRIREHGQFLQIEITNDQGRTEVQAVTVEMFRGSPRMKTQA